jgi:hypothetical protein
MLFGLVRPLHGRAKAGGRQSAKDATGKSIKSAGSALRRHNEVPTPAS